MRPDARLVPSDSPHKAFFPYEAFHRPALLSPRLHDPCFCCAVFSRTGVAFALLFVSRRCCAVGEAEKPSSVPGARIHCTQDGGKTWNQTFFQPGVNGGGNVTVRGACMCFFCTLGRIPWAWHYRRCVVLHPLLKTMRWPKPPAHMYSTPVSPVWLMQEVMWSLLSIMYATDTDVWATGAQLTPSAPFSWFLY